VAAGAAMLRLSRERCQYAEPGRTVAVGAVAQRRSSDALTLIFLIATAAWW